MAKRIGIIVTLLAIPSVILASADIVNGGFEASGTIPTGIPTAPGYWGGDVCDVVTSSDGITPYEGIQMLKFINTTAVGPSSSSVESQLFQFIDLREYADEIATGMTRIEATFYVNRIPGDSNTDTEFKISIDGFYGDPAYYPNTNYITQTDSATANHQSDGDIATWEMLSVEFIVPPKTEYICIIISARENIENDGANPEFDGHFCDNVTFTIESPVSTKSSTWGKIKRCLTVR